MTISRTISARLPLSSLYLRSSAPFEPALSVVDATLFVVCVAVPARPSVERRLMDSGRAPDEAPDASDATELSS